MNDRELRLSFPGCETVGFLYSADDPRSLGQDMLEVRHPSGAFIVSGWYPEGDPEGSYRVAVYRNRKLAQPPVRFSSMDEAAKEIERLVHECHAHVGENAAQAVASQS